MEGVYFDAFLFVSDIMPICLGASVRDSGSCTYVKVWRFLHGYEIPTMGEPCVDVVNRYLGIDDSHLRGARKYGTISLMRVRSEVVA
jgi:hypothetical protein